MMEPGKRKKEGRMRLIALVLLSAVASSASLVIHDETARLGIVGGTCVVLFLMTFERGSRIWPASLLGGAIGVLALAQVRDVGRAGWVVAVGACLFLCFVAVAPRIVTSMRELKASGSRLVAAIADKERLDRTTAIGPPTSPR